MSGTPGRAHGAPLTGLSASVTASDPGVGIRGTPKAPGASDDTNETGCNDETETTA